MKNILVTKLDEACLRGRSKLNNDNRKVANIYAQDQPGFASTLVVSSEGLLTMIETYIAALKNGEGSCELINSNMESYELLVIKNNEKMQEPFWQQLQLPYTESEFNQKTTNTYGPTEYFDFGIRGSVDLIK